MTRLTLAQADRMVDAALQEGQRQGFAPLCVAVLDAGGHLLALKRDERASLLRPQIASGKASSVLGMGFGGRELARRAQLMPAFFNALSDLAGGNMLPVPGGVLIRDGQGEIVGAIGISGDTSDNDERCALAGVEAAGWVADSGQQP
ncbi:MAG: heme-binding protein [Pseudomonas sp.]|uniref:GlcG/HbpS family heme-binding protein n=1 Tax=Pseudomonas abieticivorans TaxID=2931382 RepID=UPI0020C03F1A|nr:heme-binding protein [Pseudomonas sp. PIA16]MDE1164866.1 heme-binding protein [Pseudomonas sp.]